MLSLIVRFVDIQWEIIFKRIAEIDFKKNITSHDQWQLIIRTYTARGCCYVLTAVLIKVTITAVGGVDVFGQIIFTSDVGRSGRVITVSPTVFRFDSASVDNKTDVPPFSYLITSPAILLKLQKFQTNSTVL